MKLLFFSDLHVHSWPEHNPDTRLDDCVSVLPEIREYCNKHLIRHVFFAGDLFHKRGVLYTRAFAMVSHEFMLFKNDGIIVHTVDGNHDQEDKAGSVHAMQPLMDGGLVTGIGPEGWRGVDCEYEDRVKCEVVMFSYNDDPAVLGQRLDDSTHGDFSVPRIGLFHHGFKGARVGSVLEYVVKEPIDAKKLKLDELFDLVLCGHYHAHQPIKGLDNGMYIGSPLEHTRCDYTDDDERFKGFLVIEVDDGELYLEKVSITRPRFVKLNAGDEWTAKTVKGNFVDLYYSDPDELALCVETMESWGVRAIKPIPVAAAKETAERRLDVDPSLEPRRVLNRYAKYKRDDAEEIPVSRKELVALGLELLHEAGQE